MLIGMFFEKSVLLIFDKPVQWRLKKYFQGVNMSETEAMHTQNSQPMKRQPLTRDEINAFNEQRKNDRIQKATDRNAFVAIPEGGESQVFYSLGRSVDALFRTSRRQEIKLSVMPINEMEARIEYKKALVEFSSKLNGIGKKLGKEYLENPIIKEFRKHIDQEEQALVYIKQSLMDKLSSEEVAVVEKTDKKPSKK